MIDGTDIESDNIGARVRAIRMERKWTLAEAGKRCSVGRSTLSKIENGQMSPTFNLLRKITRGLEVDLVELFEEDEGVQLKGRRCVTRKGEGKLHTAPTYRHELLATELIHKRMLPFRSTITARSWSDFSGWVRHEGEEVILVVSGVIEVQTESYAAATLHEGDSIYFDSRMGHRVISVGPEDAEVFWVCTGDPNHEQPE
jgi:transcriptional regulator with XRE-family HTH domain